MIACDQPECGKDIMWRDGWIHVWSGVQQCADGAPERATPNLSWGDAELVAVPVNVFAALNDQTVSASPEEIMPLRTWGSDCLACGDAEPDTRRCGSCGRTSTTTPLYVATTAVYD